MRNLLLICFTVFSTICFAQSNVVLDFETGSDDLAPRDFQENLEIRIKIDGKPDVVMTNANRSRIWTNNSVRKVTINLDANTRIEELIEIQVYRRLRGNWNSGNVGVADNWNLQKLTAVANILKDGVSNKYNLLALEGTGGNPLFRFIYGPEANTEQGHGKFFRITNPQFLSTTTSNGTIITPTQPARPLLAVSEKAKINITIGTGGDDLRGGENFDILLSFTNQPSRVAIRNVFNGENLPNFSEKSKSLEIPNSAAIDINSIKEVELRHTGGGGIGADNWHVDKLKISIEKNGQSKVLVDKVGTPIHMFTGETRGKKFKVELTP